MTSKLTNVKMIDQGAGGGDSMLERADESPLSGRSSNYSALEWKRIKIEAVKTPSSFASGIQKRSERFEISKSNRLSVEGGSKLKKTI